MESKWLEDFVVLAECASFSRAAATRNVTQPAFSRRIRALEAWLGAELVDRSRHPVQLTTAGSEFRRDAVAMLAQLRQVRADLADRDSSNDVIEVALPHNLALTFYPEWLRATKSAIGPFRSRVYADNVLAAVGRLEEGGCDLLICYHHPLFPVGLDPGGYEMKTVGTDTVRVYASRKAMERKAFRLPGTREEPLPMLAYAKSAYLANIAALMMKRISPELVVSTVFEADMAETLKEMAIEEHGIAILPESAVRTDERGDRLCALATASEDLEIRFYRSASRHRSCESKMRRIWQSIGVCNA
jgi:LysR family transcriptional regulator, hypochlorite-specific transcription factor HypT